VAFGERESSSSSLGGETVRFAWRMLDGALDGLGRYPPVALAIAAVAAIGVAHAVRCIRRDRRDATPSIVAALLTSALSFAALTAFGRAGFSGVESAANDRYIYVVAALLLPLVALGGEVLARRYAVLGALPLALLLVGLPENVDLLRHPDRNLLGSRELVTAAAHSPYLDQLSADTRLFSHPVKREAAPTVGFLRAAAADGRLPSSDPSPQLELTAVARIALHQTGEPPTRVCPLARTTQRVEVERGARITFSGSIVIFVHDGAATSARTRFDSPAGDTVEVRAGPLDLTVAGPRGAVPRICRIDTGDA
jgi:hypothetical protein